MLPTKEGAIRLFRLWGVNVFLHWSWFVVAFIEVQIRGKAYGSPVWNILEYLALFGIVLMHEFGHAMACRQVGGQADQIVLWPLGGVAYVAPPQRPGATLWSIAAGPLVNVVLFPILLGLSLLQAQNHSTLGRADAATFLGAVSVINLSLLAFNMLPVYPLDGGQILRSLLWYPIGRGRSLQVATIIGFIGIAAGAAFAIYTRQFWLGLIAAFMFMNCRQGWQQAKVLNQLAALPRSAGFACPSCRTSPPRGEFWPCPQCRNAFDPFSTSGQCPQCSGRLEDLQCADCGAVYPVEDWRVVTLR